MQEETKARIRDQEQFQKEEAVNSARAAKVAVVKGQANRQGTRARAKDELPWGQSMVTDDATN